MKKSLKLFARIAGCVCLALALCAGFVGCNTKNPSGFTEKEADGMIAFDTWFFTSGVINNIIKVNGEENAVFELTAEQGWLYDGANGFVKTVVRESGDIAWWDGTTRETVRDTYIGVIEKVDDNIVGYAVIKLTYNEERSWHDPSLIKAVEFPKVNGEYQSVTQKQVKALIEENRK